MNRIDLDTRKVRSDSGESNRPHQRTSLSVPGMGSDHCAGIVSASLRRLPGVSEVHSNIANHHVEIDFDPTLVDHDALRKAVERAGYEVATDPDSGKAASSGTEVRLIVPGMGSDHCAGLVKDSLRRLPGVGEIRTNISSHQVIVRLTDDGPAPEALRAAVERAGYEVASVSTDAPSEEADVESAYLTRAWRRFVIAAVPATLIMVLMMVHMFVAPIPGYLAVIAALAFPGVFLHGGWATHVSSWRSLTNRTANMDVLISMGSLPPYLIGLVGFV